MANTSTTSEKRADCTNVKQTETAPEAKGIEPMLATGTCATEYLSGQDVRAGRTSSNRSPFGLNPQWRHVCNTTRKEKVAAMPPRWWDAEWQTARDNEWSTAAETGCWQTGEKWSRGVPTTRSQAWRQSKTLCPNEVLSPAKTHEGAESANEHQSWEVQEAQWEWTGEYHGSSQWTTEANSWQVSTNRKQQAWEECSEAHRWSENSPEVEWKTAGDMSWPWPQAETNQDAYTRGDQRVRQSRTHEQRERHRDNKAEAGVWKQLFSLRIKQLISTQVRHKEKTGSGEMTALRRGVNVAGSQALENT